MRKLPAFVLILCRRLMLAAVFAAASLPALGEEPLAIPDPRWGAFFSGKDQRVPVEPSAWPWYAIGRVNIADSAGTAPAPWLGHSSC